MDGGRSCLSRGLGWHTFHHRAPLTRLETCEPENPGPREKAHILGPGNRQGLFPSARQRDFGSQIRSERKTQPWLSFARWAVLSGGFSADRAKMIMALRISLDCISLCLSTADVQGFCAGQGDWKLSICMQASSRWVNWAPGLIVGAVDLD
ncbi:uncharacterized protein BJX67DRAFT_221531 [Aspergillus lucknowensis]|uniref:Uncharacterized protein n=1 Tax=Aspergillus lucknowensis TaxID=176173 RepID=A0ABR4LM81_9EURO